MLTDRSFLFTRVASVIGGDFGYFDPLLLYKSETILLFLEFFINIQIILNTKTTLLSSSPQQMKTM